MSCVMTHLHETSGSPGRGPTRDPRGVKRGGGEEGRGVPSAVGPPLVGRRDAAALVIDRDPPEGIVLALRVAGPVVGHEDPGQRRVTVEDDPEHVERLALVPVVGGVDAHDRGDVRVRVGRGHLEPDPAVVGHREQVVDRVQLAPGVVGVVHPAHTRAELEAQARVVPQHLRDDDQVLAADVEGDLAAVDHDSLDGVVEPVGAQPVLEGVGHLVVPPAEGPLRGRGVDDRADQAAVAAGVTTPPHAEHALAAADGVDLARRCRDVVRRLLGRGLLDLLLVAHLSRPFMSEVGSAWSAAVSCCSISALRLLPSLACWTWSWSLRIASISISGRGGQPGRYMSTGTTWSTPWTIA